VYLHRVVFFRALELFGSYSLVKTTLHQQIQLNHYVFAVEGEKMQRYTFTSSKIVKRLFLSIAAISIFATNCPMALATRTSCYQLSDGVCCVGVSAVDGQCCTNVSCTNGQTGQSCSACVNARLAPSSKRGSSVIQLGGVEHVKVNNTVLNLQWS